MLRAGTLTEPIFSTHFLVDISYMAIFASTRLPANFTNKNMKKVTKKMFSYQERKQHITQQTSCQTKPDKNKSDL